jgi:hypothetical protein
MNVISSVLCCLLGAFGAVAFYNPTQLKTAIVEKETALNSCVQQSQEKQQLINGMLMNK